MSVLLIAAALVALGLVLRIPGRVIAAMLGLLWLGAMLAHLLLPEGHALLRAIGGSWRGWLVLGGAAVAAFGYRAVLGRLRAKAGVPAGVPVAAEKSSGPFSPVELERYARHIVLRELGGPGQRRLKAARVLVLGAGGLGSPVLLYLAAAGVGTLAVIDDDTVSLSNLQRQILHADDRLGMPKVFSAEIALKAINPHVTVLPYNRRLEAETAEALFAGFDLILDGTDNFETRALANRVAVALGKPLVSGAIAQWEGQLSVYDPARGGPCAACVFPQAPAPGLAPDCSIAGVVGALPGVIGSMMALEAIKIIAGTGEPLRGRLLIYDALYGENRVMAVKPRAGCPVCGGRGAASAGM